ncbi:hypothetical protein [Pedobacter agri]|uniref:hypothetical protein n=1 Tax=Pedobacter agri TaxID=454586 RepID=UPI00292EAE8F|nr:hypothetical protein [Pedobacter agri]
MKLNKKLISLYKKSKELNSVRAQLKSQSNLKYQLPKDKELTLLEIQDAIDHHTSIIKLTAANEKLSGRTMNIEREVLTILMAIGFPARSRILINDEHCGNLSFWYLGKRIYYEEQNREDLS